MEENKEIIVEEEEVEKDEEEIVERQPSKFVTGLKKHKGIIAAVIAIAACVVTGLVLSAKKSNDTDETEEYDYDYDDADDDSNTESEE